MHPMLTASPPDAPPRELCSRSNDGIQVTLIWTPGGDELRVIVVDAKLGHALTIPVAADDAMRAFHHPYSYAAARGLLDVRP